MHRIKFESHMIKKKKEGSDEPWVETLLSRKIAWQRLPQWKFEHFVLLLNIVKHNFVQLCSSREQMTDEVRFIFFPGWFSHSCLNLPFCQQQPWPLDCNSCWFLDWIH